MHNVVLSFQCTCNPTYIHRNANVSCNSLTNSVFGMAQTVYQELMIVPPTYLNGIHQ